MKIFNFEEFNEFLGESQSQKTLNDVLNQISTMVKKPVDLNLDILIDPYFNLNMNQIEIVKNMIVKEYVEEYLSILQQYKNDYVEGTGYKTNKYHEPIQNFAYNYIKNSDFERSAKEWKSYDRNNRGIGEPDTYYYYESVWSVVCRNVEKLHGNKFQLKLDHRKKTAKNNDFDGRLVLFNPNNNSFWKKINLPQNQRYKI